MAKKAKRTTHRSAAGKKLYAVRDKSGQFDDIQTFERAHGSDVKRKSKAEKSTARKSSAKKAKAKKAKAKKAVKRAK